MSRCRLIAGLVTLALALACVCAVVGDATAATKPQFRLAPGSTGKRTCALQWLLAAHKPAAFAYGYYTGKIDCVLGPETARALKNTKWRLGYPLNAATQPVATDLFFRILEQKVNRPLEWRINAGNRANRATPFPEPKPQPKPVQVLLADAYYLIDHSYLVHYSQSTRMQIVRLRLHLPPLTRSIYEDCSSSVTGLYWLAGLPDPNQLGYSGYGYTGTIGLHGTVVWRIGQPLTLLKPGDLILYGGGTHSHVTLYLGNGRVFSHGTESGPYNLPALYRGDAVEARRYEK